MAWMSPPGGKEILPAGSYQFPFAFNLPLNLPPSFEVVPIFDLNTVPRAILPMKELKVKKLGIILFRHGEVTLECETSKGGFVPGEMVVVRARIVNDSSKDIVKAQLKLVEISSYVAYRVFRTLPPSYFIRTAGFHERQQQRRTLATGEQDLFIAKNSKGDVQLYLQVPPTVPSFDCCPIIKVEYVVEVKFESTGSVNSNIDTAVPIIIGTIPILRSAPQDEAASSSTFRPSAPPLELEYAPAYSAGSSAAETVLPPSYEESVNGIDGTTIDKDDIEPYVPRYPFFRQLSEGHEKVGTGNSTRL
ncbi:arrestin domain protein [Ancylostoma caninum]|uniref:Arrestin domain protein n=1 Tax=Ancylostoma caninum TaxID=29170 RepID=A0A368GWB4_ANCCA|nr:arrestin domain protein [Ancylostoma caninum]